MHRICNLEIKVHYIDITVFLCCFLFGPSLTSAKNQIQMAASARVNCSLLHSVHPRFKLSFETRMNPVYEVTVETCRYHLNLISSTG